MAAMSNPLILLSYVGDLSESFADLEPRDASWCPLTNKMRGSRRLRLNEKKRTTPSHGLRRMPDVPCDRRTVDALDDHDDVPASLRSGLLATQAPRPLPVLRPEFREGS